MADTHQQAAGTPAWQLVLAWAFVGIPLTLGVIKTLLNSLTLFH